MITDDKINITLEDSEGKTLLSFSPWEIVLKSLYLEPNCYVPTEGKQSVFLVIDGREFEVKQPDWVDD